jgi:two-component system phosphate regulon sensor histidine kinase PhoR
MFKNLTLLQLSIYSATVISLLFLVMTVILRNTELIEVEWSVIAFSVAALFVICFLTIRRLLGIYIYRRIKMIYKIIRDSKVQLKDGDTGQNEERILNKVESQVEKWAEDQAEEIRSLKKLEKYRRDFLGNVSHELKTPIFSVQGYVHTLLEGGLEDEKINREYLRRAANNVERLQTIVEDLEIISKLENEIISLDKQDFNLKQLCLEVIEDLTFQAKQHKITLELRPGADKSFSVHADQEAMRTVLNNLVINSIKYGKKKGWTKIGFYNMGNYILVEVEDNGIGIEEDHVKHLFDRFYRVDKSRSRIMGGSGLGLSIVKHIVEAHKQSINVRSTPGMGSTFGFTILKAK